MENKTRPDKPLQAERLRKSAEERLRELKAKHLEGEVYADTQKLIHELQVHQIELEMQNEELKKARFDLEDSRDRYIDLYDFAPVGYITFTGDGLIAEINLTCANLLGVVRQKLINGRFRIFVAPDSIEQWDAHFLSVLRHGEKQSCDLRLQRDDGSTFYARLESIRMDLPDRQAGMPGRTFAVRTAITDITMQKLTRLCEQLTRDILDLLNRSRAARDTVCDILQSVKERMGFEAVGIRLHEDGDFPYYKTSGFTDDFVLAERYLCVHDDAGNILLDEQGRPLLECMCGNVIRGRTDPALPFFTEGGSFWTNSTTELLASTTEKDRQSHTRNRCNREGYESVALIPLRSDNEVIGLLQLNDRRRNCFTLEMINFFEGLGASIGIAISRKHREQSILQAEQKYRSIVENAVEGIFQATPEGQFISVNPALASMIGYDSPEAMIKDVANVGKQLYVNPEERIRYKKILEEQDTIKGFEIQHYKKDKSKIWVSINARAVKDETGKLRYYEGTIEDITTRKLAEEELQNTLEKLRKSLAGTIQVVSMTVETRDPYTAGHQRRVANLARTIAQEMGLSNDTVDNIRMAGVIHDIGKISIPAELLAKPTKLTNIEFSLIKVHPQTGFDILKDVGLPYPVAEIVFQHHERLDGSGYPQGLKDDQILLESKILAVADVTEAIATHRPYRPALGIDVALDEIAKNKGKLYDEKVVEVCLKLFREEGFTFEGA